MEQASFVTILGARGSVPVSGGKYAEYGGATTCFHVCLAGENVLLDAGTGLLNIPEQLLSCEKLPLILTHLHLDHINGLSMSPYVMKKGAVLRIYAASSGGHDVEDILNRLYSPPVWPILPRDFAARLEFRAMRDAFHIGSVKVRTMDGIHPGGVKLLRLEGGGKCVVLATDCTLTDEIYPAAVRFASGCDLLICDGQYSDDEWPMRMEFGHNTWKRAAHFGLDCGAKAVRVVHHDPTHSDAMLDDAQQEVRAIHPGASLGREGEVIPL